MKGDRVEIVVDAGDITKTYDVAATRAGRRVEVVNRRGIIEVSEVTRGGTAVRTARFMASRVIALVEHPAPARASRSRWDGGVSATAESASAESAWVGPALADGADGAQVG
jgi:hypothetical protein